MNQAKLYKAAPWIAAGVISCIIAVVWSLQAQTRRRHAEARVQEEITQTEGLILARLQSDVDLLRNATANVGGPRGDALAWRRYVTPLQLDEKYPSLFGLGFAAYVSGEGPDHFMVRQMEPHERNARLVGFDLGTDLSARTAAEAARKTGSEALTGRLILPDDADHRAFLLFSPVMQRGVFNGCVFGRFRAEDFLKGILAGGTHLLALQVYEGPAMTRDALFFDSETLLSAWKKPNQDSMTVVKGLQVAGRTWTLNFTPRPGSDILSTSEALNALLPVIGFGLLSFAIVLFWAWSRQRAGVLAHQMLGGMRQREAALTLGPYGIIIADATQPDMPVVYVNRAFEKITGYSAQDVIGKNCRFLEGTDRDQKGLQELRRALKEQRDCRVLLRNYRKDGTPFWNDLFLSPVRNDMGRVVEMVAIQHDVTDREQTTRRLATEAAIIRALAESPSLYEAAPRILKAICESQEWDLGTFWRLDPRANVLQCVDQWRPAELELEELENFLREVTFTREMGVPGHVWEKGEQVWLSDLTKENRFPDAALAVQAGLVSACGFPIAGRRGLQGALVFYSRRIWPLSKNLLLLMVGTGAQISQYMEREKVEIEQKELTILERGLAEFMGEGLIAVDREGYCIYVNATAGRMLGYHSRTLLGQNVHDLLHAAASPAACDPSQCPLLLSLHSTRAAHVDDSGALFQRHDRDPLPVAYTTSPIIDQDLIQGVVITFVDASARRAAERKLLDALAEKEDEISRIQQMLSQTKETKNEPNPSDLLLEKIKKLLG